MSTEKNSENQEINLDADNCCKKQQVPADDNSKEPLSDDEFLMNDNPLEQKTEELQKQLQEAVEKAEESYKKYMLAVADLDNFRKRAARERQDYLRTACASVIESLLPVIDNFEIGLESAQKHPEASTVTNGFSMIAQQLKNTLSEHGLKEIKPSPGDNFDTAEHDAVSVMPSQEIPDGKIIAVARTGYKLNDKLLRPSSVVVAKND